MNNIFKRLLVSSKHAVTTPNLATLASKVQVIHLLPKRISAAQQRELHRFCTNQQRQEEVHHTDIHANNQLMSQLNDIPQEQLSSLFEQHPLLAKPQALFLYNLLNSFHFTNQDFVDVVKAIPEVLAIPERCAKINEVLSTMTSLKLTDKELVESIKINPGILLMTRQELEDRIKTLYKYFNKKAIRHLLQHTPQVIFKDTDEIKKIVHFVLFVILVPMNELIVSKALNYDFAYIKTRYEYLVRSGAFQENLQKVRHPKNPTLTTILKTPDETFAQIPGNMTLEDYQVFCRLVELEKDPFLEALFSEELETKNEHDDDDDEEENDEESEI